IGFTGGMNIGQEHIDGGKGFNLWRDTQVRFVGEASALLQAVFMVDWYNAGGENLFAPSYFPPGAIETAGGDVPVQLLTSGPDSRWAAIRQLYANMIITAEHHVSAITLLHPRREHRRGAAFRCNVGCGCKSDDQRASIRQSLAGLGRQYLLRRRC